MLVAVSRLSVGKNRTKCLNVRRLPCFTAMAWAHCAISSSSSFCLPPSSSSSTAASNRRIVWRRKTQTLAALSLPSPSKKLTKRKNYLRPKLLKTLTKPYISYPVLPQQNTEKVENFSETLEIERKSVGDGLEEGSNELKEVVLEQTVGIDDAPEALFGRLAFEVIRYSALQTICVYCVIGVVGFIKKSRVGNENGKSELGVLGSGIENGKENGILGSKMETGKENRGLVNVDESQIEEKIGEIRAMAREARESEGLAKKGSGVNGVGSSDVMGVDGNGSVPKIVVSKDKTNIEKEVDRRLKGLEKKFGSVRDKSVESSRRRLRNSSQGLRNLNQVKDHPKGFQGRKDNGLPKGRRTVAQDVSLEINGDVIEVPILSLRETQEGVHSSNGKSQELKSTQGEGSLQVIGDVTSKASVSKTNGNEEASQDMNSKTRSGCIQETSNGVVVSEKSSESKAKISQSFKKKVRQQPKFSKLVDKRTNSKPDSWWMKLPYVLAILLRRGPDPEAPKGLYSLKMDEGSSSYTVAFEDRSDAKNFCYIMESFFAELSGFSAEVVPMAIKEIESLKSSTKKILVLRKGQLHLYAGQPLVDVEMALRAIVG